jgi:hypothetical protein
VGRRYPADMTDGERAPWARPPEGGLPGAGTPPPAETRLDTPAPYGVPFGPPPPTTPRQVLYIAGAVLTVLLLVFAAGGVAVWYERVSGTVRTPADTPASRLPTAPDGSGDIDARATDPEPLTVEGVFPDPEITSFGRTYRVLRTDLATDCGTAATGTGPAALRDADCTQVVRATAVDAEGRHVVTVGIANLLDAAAAEDAEAALDEESAGAFAPMPVPGTPAAGFSPTLRIASAHGHYLVYAVGGPADGGRADDAGLRRAMKDLRFVLVDEIVARLFGT